MHMHVSSKYRYTIMCTWLGPGPRVSVPLGEARDYEAAILGVQQEQSLHLTWQ